MGDFVGLGQIWKDSGENPATILKMAMDKLRNEELSADDFLKLARFVMILHPSTSSLVLQAEGKMDIGRQLPEYQRDVAAIGEVTNTGEFEFDGKIEPGKYLAEGGNQSKQE